MPNKAINSKIAKTNPSYSEQAEKTDVKKLPPKKKARKRRKVRDGAWSRRTQNATNRKKKSNPPVSNFSTGNLLRLMGVSESPVHDSKVKIQNSPRKEPTTPQNTQSPVPKQFETPTTQYTESTSIRFHDEVFRLFLPDNKVKNTKLIIPKSPLPWIDESPVPATQMDGILNYEITKQKIQAQAKLPKTRSQNKEMKISARNALLATGISAPPRSAHWVHFIPFSLSGLQAPQNLGLGTSFANGRMELINPVLKTILNEKNAPKSLYLSALPTWVEGYEKIRLLKKITYIITHKPEHTFERTAKIEFDMLSLRPVCESEIKPIAEYLKAKLIAPLQAEKTLEDAKDTSPPSPSILPLYRQGKIQKNKNNSAKQDALPTTPMKGRRLKYT